MKVVEASNLPMMSSVIIADGSKISLGRQMLQPAEIVCASGRYARQHCLLAPPGLFDVREIDHGLQATGITSVVFRGDEDKFPGREE